MLTQEIVPNRRLTRIYPRASLITFENRREHNETRPKPCKDLNVVKQFLTEFGQQTSIHGLNKTFEANMNRLTRLFWTVGFLCALGMLIFVTQKLAARYNKRQFKTVVNSTNYPVYRIVFPEVHICNDNRLNWARFASAKENFLRPEHHKTELEQIFTQTVALYDNLRFGAFDVFESLSNKSLRSLDYVNFTNVAQFMAWRCNELLTDCVWRHNPMNCCDIFIARRSSFGFCMSFNTVEDISGQLRAPLDNKWPWRASREGPGNGLNVRVLINERLHSPFAHNRKGIMFMVMEPGVWWSVSNHMELNDMTSVQLNAQLSFFDENTRSIPSNVRECVFGNERNSADYKTLLNHKYMFENCHAECQQEYTMKYCNCTFDMFFPPSQYPSCKLSDMPCLARNNERLKYFQQSGESDVLSATLQELGMVCECFLNCLSLAYLIDIRAYDLPHVTQKPNDSFVDLDFFFMRDSIVVFRTTVVYTWVDLLVNFGNATALFLGCSVISVVELIYYFCVYLPRRIRSVHKRRKRPLLVITTKNYDKLLEDWMRQLYDRDVKNKEPEDTKEKQANST
ncbi:PREDICTED: pickpocket protein 19-like [Bactrocera latifrons]|uniref:pickpocket protein 19-like n=1 Tax=Bactrocera latifrons TaxID=174628 RepID=UPI0008DE3054|nr:PREDICTED: pickpocket protein 19-like [Bactrocera latifrons]